MLFRLLIDFDLVEFTRTLPVRQLGYWTDSADRHVNILRLVKRRDAAL